MRFPDSNLTSIADLISALKQFNINDQPVWFRGHANKRWKLTPSVARGQNAIAAEFTLIKRFKQNALPFMTNRPSLEWDWLFIMQHHGVPTRLLDWTESPLVALYFAVTDLENKDGALWCLLPKVLNENANYEARHSLELPFFGVDEVLNNYLPDTIEKDRQTSLKPMAGMAIRESQRMYAHLGVFTIAHRVPTPIEEVGDRNHIWRFIIPKDSKKGLVEELSYLSINRLALFPELVSVAMVAQEAIR